MGEFFQSTNGPISSRKIRMPSLPLAWLIETTNMFWRSMTLQRHPSDAQSVKYIPEFNHPIIGSVRVVPSGVLDPGIGSNGPASSRSRLRTAF
jgi:hypothetical protein